ncbi:hypothetical protein SAMN05421779_103184 [Insolitispirillum peregrinum]|uniref:Uncharacterized protein n=1 Tax=Insolitispirillum peregrinum TaxID=80876 RepID=A0A1N7L9C6_9PROT|nr:hypothetical protein SAMN05421779_103184 [Insolitispirillum peregrinum]
MWADREKDQGIAVSTASSPYLIQVAHRLADVSAAEWDACAGVDNPFTCYAFLSALEDSGSVGKGTGWQPSYLLLRGREDGVLWGCVPLYLKSHSYGEYVFDWSWAQAYERAGGAYYPKLQASIPFTPATGPRLLVAAVAPDPEAIRGALVRGLVALCRQLEVSSAHVTFPTAEDSACLAREGLLIRHGVQYHWENRGYHSFDDFLAALSSRKRKDIRKERQRAQSQGVRFLTLSGADLTARHWDAFYRFYQSTIDRKWGSAYLRRRFFDLLGERLGDRVVLVMGERESDGELVCGALNLRSHDTLYGRNWGADGEWKFLHFETCYYQAIDYAIAHGLRWVEAGVQGEHKIQRGYLPQTTCSAHYIAHPSFRTAVERFVEDEKAALSEDMAALATLGPYRQE